MNAPPVFHALGLHLHQPAGNLRRLIDTNPWEAEQIARCYQRPLRYARQYADVARLHVGFSGTLLEQLRAPEIIDRYRRILDIPQLLAEYREAPNIELVGMGYFHPLFPLIPRADWSEQIEAGRAIVVDTFGREPRGFWPPEMAFTMDLIPALVKAGYEYAVVDADHVRPADGVDDPFQPYLACRDGVCLTLVPSDRVLSSAQQSGLDPLWLATEVTTRCAASARPYAPRLVTSWSGGENGGWFRQLHEEAGFFGVYFAPYMERVRAGQSPIVPVLLSAFLSEHRPRMRARVQSGAWAFGSMSGFGYWTGSERQRRATTAIAALSQRYWWCRERGASQRADLANDLVMARRLLLEAQTSCYLFWGDAWLPQLDLLLQQAHTLLERIETALARGSDGSEQRF